MIVPEPPYDAEDAPLGEGDVVTAPVPLGRTITLRFASPYEPWLTLDNTRVVADVDVDSRAALLWMSRRLAALFRALDLERGLRAVLTGAPKDAGGVVVTDVIRLEDGVAADHGSLSAILDGAHVTTPPFAVLGPTHNKGELMARARTLYAAGTPLDVRLEDNERVLARRRLRVGRG